MVDYVTLTVAIISGILAIVAIILIFVVGDNDPGPTGAPGATGATGNQGPPGEPAEGASLKIINTAEARFSGTAGNRNLTVVPNVKRAEPPYWDGNVVNSNSVIILQPIQNDPNDNPTRSVIVDGLLVGDKFTVIANVAYYIQGINSIDFILSISNNTSNKFIQGRTTCPLRDLNQSIYYLPHGYKYMFTAVDNLTMNGNNGILYSFSREKIPKFAPLDITYGKLLYTGIEVTTRDQNISTYSGINPPTNNVYIPYNDDQLYKVELKGDPSSSNNTISVLLSFTQLMVGDSILLNSNGGNVQFEISCITFAGFQRLKIASLRQKYPKDANSLNLRDSNTYKLDQGNYNQLKLTIVDIQHTGATSDIFTGDDVSKDGYILYAITTVSYADTNSHSP